MDEIDTLPPPSNRGVQNSSLGALRACVDWVQVTFTTVPSLQKIYDILKMKESDFNSVSYSFYGYKSHVVCGNISVLFDGQSNMGFHVQMTGQGCREYEQLGLQNWQEFFITCFSMGANFTRLDGAIDNLCYLNEIPYFTPDKLYRKVKDGCATSKFKKGKKVESFLIDDGKNLGETLYFGKEQSDMQIRIYEKDLERLGAGEELEDDLTFWVRTEIQCRRDRAQALAIYIINDPDRLGDTLAGVLKNYLNFLIRNPNDSDKSRWKVCKWWLDFLGDVEPLKLTMIAPDKTIERSRTWINKQVAPTLGMLFMASGSDIDMIVDILNDGMDRVTDFQIAMADEYLKKVIEERKEKEYLKNAEFQKMMFRTTNTDFYTKKKPNDLNDQ